MNSHNEYDDILDTAEQQIQQEREDKIQKLTEQRAKQEAKRHALRVLLQKDALPEFEKAQAALLRRGYEARIFLKEEIRQLEIPPLVVMELSLKVFTKPLISTFSLYGSDPQEPLQTTCELPNQSPPYFPPFRSCPDLRDFARECLALFLARLPLLTNK